MFEKIETITAAIISFQAFLAMFIYFAFSRNKSYGWYIIYLLLALTKIVFSNISVHHSDIYWAKFYYYDDVVSLFVVIAYAFFVAEFLKFHTFFKKTAAFLKKYKFKRVMVSLIFLYILDCIFYRDDNRSFIVLFVLLGFGFYMFYFAINRGNLPVAKQIVLIGSLLLFLCGVATVLVATKYNDTENSASAFYYILLPGLLIETCLFSAAIVFDFFSAVSAAKEAEKLIAENELKALRAQLNPHFVQNTFNLMARQVVKPNSEESVDTIRTVSNYIRNVLYRSESTTVSIEDELDYTKEYLDIQQMMFPGLFEYEVLVENNVDTIGIMLPSMILQPLVENSIKHGFSEITEGGKITIKVEQSPEILKIEVLDNGKGIENLSVSDAQKGIEITKKRLLLMDYGRKDDSEIVLSNRTDGSGSRVLITIKNT